MIERQRQPATRQPRRQRQPPIRAEAIRRPVSIGASARCRSTQSPRGINGAPADDVDGQPPGPHLAHAPAQPRRQPLRRRQHARSARPSAARSQAPRGRLAAPPAPSSPVTPLGPDQRRRPGAAARIDDAARRDASSTRTSGDQPRPPPGTGRTDAALRRRDEARPAPAIAMREPHALTPRRDKPSTRLGGSDRARRSSRRSSSRAPRRPHTSTGSSTWAPTPNTRL